jgi:glycosyltransferase involved in cell wall biosynthesis
VIICQSQLMQDELQRFFSVPADRLKVLHNMLPVEDIITKANEPITELNLQPFDILTCGRLVPQKGFDILIESFFVVKQRHPSARLVILGEGLGIQNQRNILEAKVAALGLEKAVLMPGHNANPYKFMSRSAVFVSSSRWEGLPNAVLEAMACGATVVATDCPGATGEIIEHGKNGWLVPPENVPALADAIDNVLSGNWKLNADIVREQAKHFDISNILPKFDLLLSEQLTEQ